MANKKLTAKQSRFVEEYLIDMNATQAAIKAGYSKKTAKSQGQRLLTNVDIASAIKKVQDKISAKLDITREELLNDLRIIKNAHKDGEGFPPHALKAIEIINKMLGFNAADKQEITLKGEQPLFGDDEDEDKNV